MPQRAPLPRVCIALGFPDVDKLLEQARREIESGEHFLEFRLDYLVQPERGADAIREFLAEHGDVTLLATCRRHQNHGRFNGSIEEQIRILDSAADAGARALDVEIETAEVAIPRIEALRAKAFLVVSYHNFEGTPALEPVFRRMSKVPADALKIVTTARKPSDNFRVLSLARQHARIPVIVLAMGEIGFPTRVLATAFGGIYTYAAPMASEGTASG
ncbi:MAG: type I 3-dehydroquinate dehydratase, partial [Acidobacteria bacterium]|nr:type I 3-dehydroquinate dehydratase [Acidobacteriota bacterium]